MKKDPAGKKEKPSKEQLTRRQAIERIAKGIGAIGIGIAFVTFETGGCDSGSGGGDYNSSSHYYSSSSYYGSYQSWVTYKDCGTYYGSYTSYS